MEHKPEASARDQRKPEASARDAHNPEAQATGTAAKRWSPAAVDRREWVLAALDQFEGRLLRYAQRLLDDAEEARDVVQVVFLRLCDQSPDKIGDRLAQWLYTVCRNRAMDVLRCRERPPWRSANGHACGVPVGGEANHSSPGWPCGHPQPPDREPDPADSAEQAELHALLRALIEHLPNNQREAIDLWADGFSYQQIADITNQKEGHVRVLVHRGLKTLREHPRVRALIDEATPTRSVSEGRTETRSVSEGTTQARSASEGCSRGAATWG